MTQPRATEGGDAAAARAEGRVVVASQRTPRGREYVNRQTGRKWVVEYVALDRATMAPVVGVRRVGSFALRLVMPQAEFLARYARPES